MGRSDVIDVGAVRATLRAARLGRAIRLGRMALVETPAADEVHYLLAHAWLRASQLDRARRTIVWAIRLRPDRAEFRASLGDVLSEIGRLDAAAASYRAACARGLGDARVLANLGQALRRAGRLEESAHALRAALVAQPDAVFALNRWAPVADAIDVPGGAPRWFARSRLIAPGRADTIGRFGLWLYKAGRLDAARAWLRAALLAGPADGVMVNGLGLAELACGDAQAALPRFRRAALLLPGTPQVESNLRLCMSYRPDPAAAAHFRAARRWADRHAPPLRRLLRRHDLDRSPERRLRIAYLSADLHDHPVAGNVEDLLAAHDRERFEILCYADVARPDGTTARLRRSADVWRSIVGLSDAAVAELIRADRADVLIVLAGSFAGNRLVVCAARPAPVQISMFDIGTSGLDEVDYWLTDAIAHPADGVEKVTERLLRLPCWIHHRPPQDAPSVAARDPDGPVLFGSFNNPAKIGPEAVALWARVLRALPDARLVLRYFGRFGQDAVVARYSALFGAEGVARERITFSGAGLDRHAHLAAVSNVDIALDSTPFNGSTATFQALWMGVPVITLAGDRFVSRMTAAQLAVIGAPDLVAETADAFVARAVGLARDPARRAALRATLRDRVAASPLCDAAAYARAVEDAYRSAWRRWCVGPPEGHA